MRKQSISCTLQVAGCRLKKIFTSIILASCILHLASFNLFAAPHITRGKPEPPSKVGKHLSERMKAKMFAPMLANATTGTVKVLFLKVDFPADTDATTTGDGTWADPVYANSGNSDYWINKDKNDFISYYNEVSYGQLNLTVDVFPQAAGAAYRLSNPMTSYGNESDSALTNLIYDSVTKAEAVDGATINFSNYDAILIVHAGAGEETDTASDTSNDLWSLHWSQSTPIVTADGKGFSEAIIMPQTGTQDGSTPVDPLGIYVHEFGHWLGLPDLYYTASWPPNLWDGVGKWSLMGDGIYLGSPAGSSPAHLDAWCKSYLGWVKESDSSLRSFSSNSDPGNKTLLPVEGNRDIIKLPASTTTSSQYFLLENRQQTGFDVGLPGSGILVWLIDEAVINANIGNNTVNNNPLRPGVKLIEADGKNDLMSYGGDYGGPGDPFPYTPNQSFTPFTNPASTPYLGSAWLYVNNITVSGSNISATIGFAPVAPSGLAVSHNSVTLLTWTAGTEADLAKYKVYRNSTFLADTTASQYTDTTSSSGDAYTVTAVDSNGYESAKSTSVTISFATGSAGSSGGGCFIATAAYGSYEAPYVKILREFRDRYLLKSFEFRVLSFEFEIPNIVGRASVALYYKVSPPIADFIRESEVLKFLVRIILLPLIGMAAFLVKTTFLQKCIALGVLIIGQAFIAHKLRRLSLIGS